MIFTYGNQEFTVTIDYVDENKVDLEKAKAAKAAKIAEFKLDTKDMTEESIKEAEARLAELKIAAKGEIESLSTIEDIQAYEFNANTAEELLVKIRLTDLAVVNGKVTASFNDEVTEVPEGLAVTVDGKELELDAKVVDGKVVITVDEIETSEEGINEVTYRVVLDEITKEAKLKIAAIGKLEPAEVAYKAIGKVTEISDEEIIFANGKFIIPITVKEFTFKDSGYLIKTNLKGAESNKNWIFSMDSIEQENPQPSKDAVGKAKSAVEKAENVTVEKVESYKARKDLDGAKELVYALVDSKEKDALIKRLGIVESTIKNIETQLIYNKKLAKLNNEAKSLLEENALAEGVDQSTIDEVRELVSELKYQDLYIEADIEAAQEKIDKAQGLLDAKLAAQALKEAKDAKKSDIKEAKLNIDGMTEKSIELAEAKLVELKIAAEDEVENLNTIEEVQAYKFDIGDAEELLVSTEDQEAEDLAKAKVGKKAEINVKVPAENYTKNKKAYNSKVEDVKKEIDALETVLALKDYNIEEQFEEIYTNKDIEEITEINEYTSNKIIASRNEGNYRAKMESFKTSYKTSRNQLSGQLVYEIAIDKSEQRRSVIRLSGTGLATALVEPLTLGRFHGVMKDVTDIIPSLDSVNVIDLNDTNRSAIFAKGRLTKIVAGFGGVDIFDVFMPAGEKAGIFTRIGVLVGGEYQLEYNHTLTSGKSYIETSIIKFTDDYIEQQ